MPRQPADLLQVDLLNPHYPLYYGDPAVPPSDDQNPTPVYFLALSPGVRLTFAFRAVPWNQAEDSPSAEEVTPRVRAWLLRGLTEQGAGAKTAAGYGYLSGPEQPGSATADTVPPSAEEPSVPPEKKTTAMIDQPSWQMRARGMNIGQARDRVPPLLASLQGEERRAAASHLIEQLGRRKLKEREEQEWVKTLLAAARE